MYTINCVEQIFNKTVIGERATLLLFKSGLLKFLTTDTMHVHCFSISSFLASKGSANYLDTFLCTHMLRPLNKIRCMGNK